MSGRNKHAEVASARSRLGATLQYLVDKKDESQPSSDGEGSQQDLLRSSSPALSPRKSASKSNRKRKRKDLSDGSDAGNYLHTYVMKLFDRSVDMAQFDEDTPLYPICRAWIKNQPHNRSLGERSPSPEPEPAHTADDETGEKFPDIHHLPPPIKQERADQDEDLRIPQPVPRPLNSLDIHADPEKAPPPEQLLLNHMARWKRVRFSWKESAAQNELRYGGSMRILKEMFDRQCK